MHCPYMGTTVHLSASEKSQEGLLLAPEIGIFLLAIAPIAEWPDGEVQKLVLELRKNPFIFQTWNALSRIEFLVFQSVLRTESQPALEFKSWFECLKKSVENSRDLSNPYLMASEKQL